MLAALAGIEHGVGEIRQGSIAPPSIAFESWAGTAAFDILDGEPAMTLIPNLALTGVVAILVALALGVWAARFALRRHGGLVLMALSLLLLLVGGGFAPPLTGIIAGAAAMRARRPVQPAPGRLLQALAPRWPWLLIVGVTVYLALVPGMPLLSHFAGVASEALVGALTLSAFGALVLALVAARAHDRVASRVGGDAHARDWTPR